MEAPQETEMFIAKKPEYILTDQGLMSVAKFAKENGFEWTESPIGTQAAKDYIVKNRSSIEQQQTRDILIQKLVDTCHRPNPNSSEGAMLQRLGITKKEFLQSVAEDEKQCGAFLASSNKYTRRLVIRNINDIIGKGVYVAEKEVIKKGEIVSSYPGKYETSNFGDKRYGLKVPKHCIFSSTFSSSADGHIDAKYFGSISRFFNDLPKKEELAMYYNIPKTVLEKIVTANLILKRRYYQGCPIPFFIATEDIEGNMQLGFSYGIGYFASAEYLYGIKRCFFDKDNNLIDEKSYTPKFYNLAIKIGNTTDTAATVAIKIKDLKDCIIFNKPYTPPHTENFVLSPFQLILMLVKKFSSIDLKKEEGGKCKFSCSIRLILADYLVENAYNSNTEKQCAMLKKFQDSIANIKDNDADTIYESVFQEFYEENKQFYIKNLPSIRQEIIDVMHNYKNFQNITMTINDEKFSLRNYIKKAKSSIIYTKPLLLTFHLPMKRW